MEAKQRRGQNQMVNGVPEHRAVPGQQRIHRHQSGAAWDYPLQSEIQTSRASHPAKPGVEQQQPHHPDPENRRGITRQTDDAHHVVGNAVAPRRRQYAQRNAQTRTDDNRHRRQLERRREDAQNIGSHRFTRQQRVAQIAVQQVIEVNTELSQQRPVESQLVIDLLIGAVVGIRSDNRQHRIDGHYAADEKGQQQKAEQRHHHLR